MKVPAISQMNNINHKKTNSTNKTYNQSFKGYVNGKFFRDEIILEAKEALKNPNWKDKFLNSKRSLGETLATWHEREGANDIAGRVLMGIFSLGITEVTWGLAYRAMDVMDNNTINKKIKEIEECMKNLRTPNNGATGIEE